MPGANRHRPPNTLQLVKRIYRRQIESEKLISDLKAEIARLTDRFDINANLAAHCRRLLREKATLLQVIEANQFMAGRSAEEDCVSEPIPFEIDDDRSILIYGVRYSMGFFQHFGAGPIGSIVRVVQREDKTVTLEHLQDFRPSRNRAIELLRNRSGSSDWEKDVEQFLLDIDANPFAEKL